MDEIMRKENNIKMRQAGRVMGANAETNMQNISPDEFYKKLERYESATSKDIIAEMREILQKINLSATAKHFGIKYHILLFIADGRTKSKPDFLTYCKVTSIDTENGVPAACFFKNNRRNASARPSLNQASYISEYNRYYYEQVTKPKRQVIKEKRRQQKAENQKHNFNNSEEEK